MSSQDRALQKILAELSVQERIDAWLDAMRRAGGLAFMKADEETAQELYDLEDTMPMDDRRAFHSQRDAVLAVNALMSLACRAQWLRAEATLARITTLLSLLFIAKSDDSRKHLEHALEQLEAGDQTADHENALINDSTNEAEIIEELAKYSSVMFKYEDSPLAYYWSEVLEESPLSEPRSAPLKLSSLLKHEGEAIERVLSGYAAQLYIYAAEPEEIRAIVVEQLSVVLIHREDVLLPPILEHLDRNKQIVQLLDDSAWMPEVEITGPSDRIVKMVREMLDNPSRFEVSASLISAYSSWLRGQKWSGYGLQDYKPWQYYYPPEKGE